MPTVGDNLNADRANWKFSGDTVDSFDEHVSKSVPLYNEGHELICDISDFFIKPTSICYEIGCSTGELTIKLAEHNSAKPNAQFIGIDIELDMVNKAESKLKAKKEINVSFIHNDIFDIDIEVESIDMIVCYYTMQFISPAIRQAVVDKLYKSLAWGGALLFFEKVRGSDARFQDIVTTLYTDYKLRKGYTSEEIVSKARSLKGVLEPFSTQGNIDLLKRAGFTDINTIQKYLCFEGFLAIK